MKKISTIGLKLWPIWTALSITLLLGSCQDTPTYIPVPEGADAIRADFAHDYMALSLKISKETPGFTPPVAARAFGYLGLCLYEASVHGMKGYRSLQGVLNQFPAGSVPAPEAGKEYHWGICASAATAEMMFGLYKSASQANRNEIINIRQRHESAWIAQIDPDIAERSRELGKAIGLAIYNYSVSDGLDLCYQDNFPASYTLPEFPGAWKPTPPTFLPALQPYWGEARPFVGANVLGTQPPIHPAYASDPTSLFYAQGLEVWQVSQNLTQEQKVIAEFWSDDPEQTFTPGGHSMAIAMQVLQQENANLTLAAETYAKVGMALHDAFVSCWKTKYDYNLIRPVHYIRQHFNPAYNSHMITPPFPEFTSGHSVQAGAAMQVLADLFGNGYKFTDRSHVNRTDIDGTPRSFNTFIEIAQEAAISRLYGGIHYRAAIEFGVEQGQKVGRNIGALPFKE